MRYNIYAAVVVVCAFGCGAEGEGPEGCAETFVPYTRPSQPLQECLSDPNALVGKTEAEVRACGQAPCFSAMTHDDGHVALSWWLYCDGDTCANDCPIASRVYFENGRVSYVRVRSDYTATEDLQRSP